MKKENSRPNFILLTGPPAVGKMTVGQHLSELTDYKLFHNHQSIDFALQYYDWSDPGFRRINEGIRQLMFKTAVESKSLKGFIFTLVWAFNEESDNQYVADLENLFTKNGWGFYIVELCAPLEKRISRNATDNRLVHKKSKRDIEKSEENLKVLEKSYQMNSEGSLDNKNNYLFIDNSNLMPDKVADMVVSNFELEKNQTPEKS